MIELVCAGGVSWVMIELVCAGGVSWVMIELVCAGGVSWVIIESVCRRKCVTIRCIIQSTSPLPKKCD